MNALAPVLSPNVPAGAPARADDADANTSTSATDRSGFAQCMAHAQQAQAAPPGDDEPAADDARGDAPADASAPAADPAPTAPDLAALLPGWAAAPTVTASDGASVSAPAASGDAALALHARTAKAVAAADASSVPQAVAAAATPAAAERSHDLDAPAHAGEAAARLPAEPRAKAAETALTAMPGAPAPAAPVTAPRATDAAAPTAHLSAPIDTPAFAPSLATQVRWWAHDGVQQAQLTLNPPEMGPVTVKIVLHDQREARVDFIADMAATRSALEAALPVLAAALDESGLKLAGGGVHDGAAQRQALWQQAQQHGAPASRGASAPAAGQSVTAPGTPGAAPAHGARGLVDLVA